MTVAEITSGGLRRFAERTPPHCRRIEWKGAVWGEARWPYFQGADLFCLPTHSENFGLAILDACQVGTPALTTTETPWSEALGAVAVSSAGLSSKTSADSSLSFSPSRRSRSR